MSRFGYVGARDLHLKSVELARCVRRVAIPMAGLHVVDRAAFAQMYRAGTSVGANIRESQFAESTKDVVHKLNVAKRS